MGFSENLKEIRKAKKWSQQKLADKLKVARQTIIEWEDPDGNRPSFDCLVELVATLRVSWGRLMAGEKGKNEKSNTISSGEALLKLGEVTSKYQNSAEIMGEALLKLGKVASEYHQALDNTNRKESEK